LNLLRLTKYGIYCPQGDFYIDASGKVDRNIVTHAHSDHARPGHKSYLAQRQSLPLLKSRLGKKINVQSLEYGEEILIDRVKVSLHPAGHIYGSSQVKIDYSGEIWVVSGDYKLEDDKLSTPFEAIKCDTFVTECTFGLPVYNWLDQQRVYEQINSWWRSNKADGITSLLFGYSLGKSQRIIKNIDHSIGSVYVHKTVGNMNDAIRSSGGELHETYTINEDSEIEQLEGNLIIAPPSITSGRLIQGIGPISTAMASGWAQTGRNFGRRGVDRGFVLSDHADWDGLLRAISATGTEEVITMHGYTKELSRYLNEQGVNSIELDQLKNQHFRLD
jgi:putative mRNA 3-end processing factor